MAQRSLDDEDSAGEGFSGKAVKGDTVQPHLPTMMGRTSGNKVVVFQSDSARPGDYVNVTITRSTSATLIGKTI
jgi:tRNA A37 methylthiotransferase MiaB